MRVISSGLVLAIFITGAGCQGTASRGASQDRSTLARISSYLSGLEAGYPVAEIELDLRLPPPVARYHPVRHPSRPVWRITYAFADIRMSFDAFDISGENNGSYLIYAGSPEVLSEQEYRALVGVPRAPSSSPRQVGDPSKASDVRSYLANLHAGFPVSIIERELHLPESTDREAPSSKIFRPLWSLNYRSGDLLIRFDAIDISIEEDEEDFVYLGNPSVMTVEEYKQMLRRMGVPAASQRSAAP